MLATYSQRRSPIGERAALSSNSVTWDAGKVIVPCDDAKSADLGYPASLEISPGTVLTVYYQRPSFDPADKLRQKTTIMATLWRAPQVN